MCGHVCEVGLDGEVEIEDAALLENVRAKGCRLNAIPTNSDGTRAGLEGRNICSACVAGECRNGFVGAAIFDELVNGDGNLRAVCFANFVLQLHVCTCVVYAFANEPAIVEVGLYEVFISDAVHGGVALCAQEIHCTFYTGCNLYSYTFALRYACMCAFHFVIII